MVIRSLTGFKIDLRVKKSFQLGGGSEAHVNKVFLELNPLLQHESLKAFPGNPMKRNCLGVILRITRLGLQQLRNCALKIASLHGIQAPRFVDPFRTISGAVV